MQVEICCQNSVHAPSEIMKYATSGVTVGHPCINSSDHASIVSRRFVIIGVLITVGYEPKTHCATGSRSLGNIARIPDTDFYSTAIYTDELRKRRRIVAYGSVARYGPQSVASAGTTCRAHREYLAQNCYILLPLSFSDIPMNSKKEDEFLYTARSLVMVRNQLPAQAISTTSRAISTLKLPRIEA
ncbi:hypothetical protein E2986_13654 [Frieseomelitta varia]|uniref:Uncharacterized protein n=1 Tax=Frieseomelitta varia TaxID=561572 RepID=A0A833RBA5_9HYME|nr:hypothetical protein E2986_13654 [Frieseomelitta varia]